ncbi:MAG: glycosyltransferase [Mojavia pulchra JT2-VF2]|jgi:glycosyltransferase involved in cell wall biosynthesis|uniref:Glycosyltransferase n=1 Tax=Mojavia pulchra JT2-VF2 TaxID=287848 RepID=A0A951Q5B3_9NOST|nr:glycosyltransferase [Mojavia pulchra JT2-VF2]
MNQLVSIIVNNYNYAQFLPEAVDSALNQTYPNIEVIVVDDGSTDNSQEIITSYGSRILPVIKQNGGQASALNAGFAVSKGEIIIFLDADDYLFSNTVEEVVIGWKSDIAKVQYRIKVVDASDNFICIYPGPELPFAGEEVLPVLLNRGWYTTAVTSGNAFNRCTLAQILPIPESEFRISADGYLVTLAPFYGRVVSIDQPLAIGRVHGSNSWAISGEGVQAERLRKSIKHDFQKYKFLQKQATELGYTISHNLGCRDYFHLTYRLASLRLDAQNHPVSSDSPLDLAGKGYWAIWKYTDFPWKRKLLLSTWFLWVGLMPQPLIKPAIYWLVNSESRPKFLNKLLQKIRSIIP